MQNIKKYLIIVSFLAILTAPSFVSADTITDLQAQINALLAQVQALQAQLAQMQGQPATWCHDFSVNLKYGDSGSEVEALQTALTKEGFAPSKEWDMIAPSKYYFGELTASSVTGFQEKYKNEILIPLGLKYGTGYAGSATRAKLNKLYGCGTISSPIACPADARMCSDGTYVSRISPACNFAPCPTPTPTPTSAPTPALSPINKCILPFNLPCVLQ